MTTTTIQNRIDIDTTEEDILTEREVVEAVINPEYSVMQSNSLIIQARQIEPLTKTQQKLILSVVSLIEPTDEDFKIYRIPVREIANILGLAENSNWVYRNVKSTLTDIMKKPVELPSRSDDGKDFTLVNWFSTADYIAKDGIVEISFSPAFKPYLLQLKEAYTVYSLSNVLNISSAYSIRLYELFKAHEKEGIYEVTHEELCQRIGAISKLYERYYNFKTKVLLKSIGELNEKTELNITLEEVRINSKKLNFLRFYIEPKLIENAVENTEVDTGEVEEYALLIKKVILRLFGQYHTVLEELDIKQTALKEITSSLIAIFSEICETLEEVENRVIQEFGYLIEYVLRAEKLMENALAVINQKIENAVMLYNEFAIEVTFKGLLIEKKEKKLMSATAMFKK